MATPSVVSLTQLHTPRFTNLWKLVRADGFTLRFTDHDSVIEFEGSNYTPVGGFDVSAMQRQSGLKENNLELVGVLSSPAITDADLFAGLYRNASLDHYVVDWAHPWAGKIDHNVLHIVEISWSGSGWVAQVSGITSKVRRRVGRVLTRNCDNDLGDAFGTTNPGCFLDLTVMRVSAAVVSSTNQRIFLSNIVNVKDKDGANIAITDTWFSLGRLTWTSGTNNGTIQEVRSNTGASILLAVPAPFAIDAADTFTIDPGCDKLIATCNSKFGQIENHAGVVFIIGTQDLTVGPRRANKLKTR